MEVGNLRVGETEWIVSRENVFPCDSRMSVLGEDGFGLFERSVGLGDVGVSVSTRACDSSLSLIVIVCVSLCLPVFTKYTSCQSIANLCRQLQS